MKLHVIAAVAAAGVTAPGLVFTVNGAELNRLRAVDVPAAAGATAPAVPGIKRTAAILSTRTGRYMPVADGRRVGRGAEPLSGPEADRWAAILEKALSSGTSTEGDGVLPASRYLADITGPGDGPHKADYFSVWGYADGSGAFYPDFVTMVSENWEITPDGNWRISQWIHWLDLDGAPQDVSRAVLVEDMNGSLLDVKTEQLEVSDPRAQENRSGLLEKWHLFKPSKN